MRIQTLMLSFFVLGLASLPVEMVRAEGSYRPPRSKKVALERNLNPYKLVQYNALSLSNVARHLYRLSAIEFRNQSRIANDSAHDEIQALCRKAQKPAKNLISLYKGAQLKLSSGEQLLENCVLYSASEGRIEKKKALKSLQNSAFQLMSPTEEEAKLAERDRPENFIKTATSQLFIPNLSLIAEVPSHRRTMAVGYTPDTGETPVRQ